MRAKGSENATSLMQTQVMPLLQHQSHLFESIEWPVLCTPAANKQFPETMIHQAQTN